MRLSLLILPLATGFLGFPISLSVLRKILSCLVFLLVFLKHPTKYLPEELSARVLTAEEDT